MLVSTHYERLRIRTGVFWDLFLNEDQTCPGRAYIWWKDRTEREGETLSPEAIPLSAWQEKMEIYRDLKHKCWRALGHKVDLTPMQGFLENELMLRNNLHEHNGHMHIQWIPRFKEPIYIKSIGTEFTDIDWATPYRGITKRTDIGANVLLGIHQEMVHALG